MKTVLGILAACCCMAAAETALERGKRVIDEALKAMGGDAYLHMEDRVESGRAYSFFREQLSGLSVAKIYSRFLAPNPGKLSLRERQTFGKDESSAVLFNENGAWEITFRGARPLEDLRFQNYIDSRLRNIFYILRERLNEPGLILYSQGSELYNNLPVEVVDITDADNRTVTVYFSQSTKLPVKQTFRRRNPQYKDFDTEVSEYAKFRDVGGGVKWPFDVRSERNGEKIYEMYAESVKVNTGLKDNLFTLPADMKILPKAK